MRISTGAKIPVPAILMTGRTKFNWLVNWELLKILFGMISIANYNRHCQLTISTRNYFCWTLHSFLTKWQVILGSSCRLIEMIMLRGRSRGRRKGEKCVSHCSAIQPWGKRSRHDILSQLQSTLIIMCIILFSKEKICSVWIILSRKILSVLPAKKSKSMRGLDYYKVCSNL